MPPKSYLHLLPEAQASIPEKKSYLHLLPEAQAPSAKATTPTPLETETAPAPGLGTQFTRGLAEGLTGARQTELDAAKTKQFVTSLGGSPEEATRAGELAAQRIQEPTDWQGKAALFTGKMTGELLGFVPALGAVKAVSAIPKVARTVSGLGKHARPAVEAGLAGGLQETGQAVFRKSAGIDETAGQRTKDIAISTAAFGGGDYFFRRVLIPAIKVSGGSVKEAIRTFRGKRGAQPSTTARKRPETPLKRDSGAFNAETEAAVRASGANIDDVSRAADDILEDPVVQAGFAKDATIPDKLPDDIAAPIKEELKRRGVERLTPEEVMKLRQSAMRMDVSDEVIQGFKSAKTPDPGTTLPGTAIKVETIASGEDAAKVVSELMKTMPPSQPKTLAEMNSKLTQYGIQNFDDQTLPEVIEEVGLQVRAMEVTANDSMNTLYKLVGEGASKEKIAKALTNSQLLLNSVRDARSEFGRQFRGLRPDARIPAKIARQMKKEEEKLLKNIEGYLGKGDELPDDFVRAMNELDRNSPEQMVQFLNQFRNPGKWERLGTFRINNLVSAPATMMINVTGNAVQNVMATAVRPVAAGLDIAATPILRALGKNVKRDRFLRESSYIWSLTEQLPAAARASMRAITHGEKTIGGTKIDLPGAEGVSVDRILSSPLRRGKLNKVAEAIDRVLTFPARAFLQAPDEFMKTISLDVHRKALAMREVMKRMPDATAAERKAEITKILNSKMDPERIALLRTLGRTAEADLGALANKIEDDAISGTLKNVFQHPDSRAANAIMKMRDMGPLSKPLQLIFPFIRTPIQIAERGLEFFPPYQAVRLGLKSFERGPLRKIGSKGEYMDELAKLTIGLSLTGFTTSLVTSGRMTGGRLAVPDEQRRLEAATVKPYTINVGGRSYEMGRLDPVAFPIALSANIAEAYAQPDSLVTPEEAAFAMTKGMGAILKDKLYIKQISDLVELFSSTDDEEKLARGMSKFVTNIGAQMVPYSSLVSRIGRVDDAQRFRATGVSEAFTRRYGLGDEKTLFGYYDALGQKVFDVLESEGDLGRKVYNFAVPFRTTEPQNKPIIDELVRLQVSASTGELQRKNRGVSYTPAEFAAVNEELRNTVIPALDAIMNGGNVDVIANAFPQETFAERRKARRQAQKFVQSYHMLPDNDYVASGFRGRFEKGLSKEGVVVGIIQGARRKARESVWQSSVLPRLELQGLTAQDIEEIRLGIRKEEEFGLGD